MRKTSLLASALMTLSTAVYAEDWDGWFAGFEAGYIYRSIESTASPQKADLYGGLAGITVGHWWQFDPVTLGFDLSASIGGAQINYVQPNFGGVWTTTGGEAATVSARAKVGATIADTMVYAAGGLQYLHNYYTSTFASNSSPPSSMHNWSTQGGVILAVGAEQRIGPSVSLKGEIGYNAVWSDQSNFYSGWSVKTGLNYYF